MAFPVSCYSIQNAWWCLFLWALVLSESYKVTTINFHTWLGTMLSLSATKICYLNLECSRGSRRSINSNLTFVSQNLRKGTICLHNKCNSLSNRRTQKRKIICINRFGMLIKRTQTINEGIIKYNILWCVFICVWSIHDIFILHSAHTHDPHQQTNNCKQTGKLQQQKI